MEESEKPHQTAEELLADKEKRRQLETELARLGMSPVEVRRLLEADAHSTDPPPVSEQPKQVVAAASLQGFAAQLQTNAAAERLKALEKVSLDLPEFRESTPAEIREAEQLLRDANVARRREQYKEAEEKCRAALRLVPKDAAALEFLGDLYQGTAHVDEALTAYKRALEADPKRTAAERKFGELLMQQQSWETPDPEVAPKNAWFAVMLSAVFPGAGQFHNGDYAKGVFFLCAAAVLIYVLGWSPLGFSSMRRSVSASVMIAAIIAGVLYIVCLIDANVSAKQGQRRGGRSGWEV